MKKKKILIVDDDPSVVEELRILFSLKGHDVSFANDGLRGIALAREIHPDLIFLDLLMPRMDGLKFARLFKFDERYKDVPIIAITHLSRESSEANARTMGINDFFSKPLDTIKLEKIAEKYLQG